jgi:antitoxin ParD1/3/4
MTVALHPDQEEWFKTRVARGDFVSVEEAARQFIDERIAEREAEESDEMEWAKPYVDEALAEVERGDVIPLEEHESRNEARLAAMR